jgi:glycosyltransferase involved in cell wall biosynthesis
MAKNSGRCFNGRRWMTHKRQTDSLRVTHVVFDLQGGGMESLVAAMVTKLTKSSVRSSVITLSGRQGRVGAAIRPHLDHLVPFAPLRGVSMAFPLGLANAIRRTNPDIVHLHSGAWFKGALAARLAGAGRVIFTEHGRVHHDPWMARQLDRLASRLTDVVVPVSCELSNYLHERLRIPLERLRVVENGVDVTVFAPGAPSLAMRERWRIPPDALVIGSVGRLERVKGYDRLLEVFAALKSRGTHANRCRLVLCGEGSERASLAALAARLGLEDSVTFAGWVEASAEVYRCFDVFAVTSRSEGLSISLLEAMASGVAPVVNDVGANREVLGPELRQYAVPAEAWDSFAGLVGALLEDPAARAHVGARASARVRERYSLDRVVAQYLEVYQGSARDSR